MNANKVSIFDFCETLVDFQTADRFVQYVTQQIDNEHIKQIEKKRRLLKRFGVIKISNFVAKLTGNYLNKKILLSELVGLSRDQIDEFAKQYYLKEVRPHIIPKVLNCLLADKANGYIIILISASYEPVLKNFVSEFGIDILITNEFEYINNLFTGKLCKKDCQRSEKVKRLRKIAQELIVNADDIKSYSDSKTDIPILRIANQRIVISHQKKQVWANIRHFNEIIW